MRTLLPHQKQALDFARTRNHLALFMEMRLGKTLTTIHWIEMKEDIAKALIVGPKSVLPGWKEELEKEGHASVILEGVPEERMIILQGTKVKYYLINYEGVQKCPQIINYHWDCIVYDESTKIRNPKAQITKLLIKQAEPIPYKAILSGYPCPESEQDYVTQFIALQGNFMDFRNFWKFREAMCTQILYDWILKPSKMKEVKEYVKANSFILTRTEANMGSRKVYSTRYLELGTRQKRAYKAVLKDFEFDGKDTKYTIVKLGWLQQITGGFFNSKDISVEKRREILSLLRGELQGQKVIVWCKHTEEIEGLQAYLQSKHITADVFTGEKKGSLSGCQVLIAQAKCGMMGLDFSAADTAIYYSNWPDGEIRAQSEDRIIHPSKTTSVLYIDLVTKDTIDEDILELLKDKTIRASQFSLELSRRIFDVNKQLFSKAKTKQ